MDTIRVAEVREAAAVGREVRLQGWIRTRRDSKGGFSFLEVNDGSSLASVQVIADGTLANYESEVKHLGAGASVTVEGLVKASPAKGQATEVQAARIIVHGLADPETYPLQKKHHSFEFLRTIAHLRPRTNTFGAVSPGAQLRQPIDPQFLPGGRLPLYSCADHHGQRLRRGGRDVQGHDARPGQGAQVAHRRRRLHPGLLRSPGAT